MTIKPLRNQVLIRLLPPEYEGLIFHDLEHSERGAKLMGRKGVVVAVGKWRTTKQGLSILPDFHPGQRVWLNEYTATKLTRDIGENYRLCKIDDVLAVCEETLNGVS